MHFVWVPGVRAYCCHILKGRQEKLLGPPAESSVKFKQYCFRSLVLVSSPIRPYVVKGFVSIETGLCFCRVIL